MSTFLAGATPAGLLADAEALVEQRRWVEVEQLQVVLAWADTFSGDPQAEPGAVPVRHGGPRLIVLGGEGTPAVADLPLVELAIARCESVHATRRATADALDLRHRLPAVWVGVQALRCEVWVARKVAAMSRRLTAAQATIVDHAVAEALDQAPGRILAIAEATVIEADVAAHEERIAANKQRKGVWFPTARPADEEEMAGLATLVARIDEADARAHARIVEDLAAALEAQADEPMPADHWRAEAFAMLADPAAVLAFLKGDDAPPRSAGLAEVVVHVAVDHDGDLGVVARVECLGPRTMSQVRELLAPHASVAVQPVIDLHEGRSVNGYEHPSDVRRRTELRTLGDVFPHATAVAGSGRRPPDHDHTAPYERGGPPGQTGDHNDSPLTRHHHRAKTHGGYEVHQLGPNRWIWRTPHGLCRLVTATGTTSLSPVEFHLRSRLDPEIRLDLAA